MALEKIYLENFTVFDKIAITFCDGINVFIGENGTGKTHIMKILYAACQAAQMKKTAIDFQTKLVRVFRPDDASILRLARRGVGAANVRVEVSSPNSKISLTYSSKLKASLSSSGSDKWEKEFSGLSSTFIPAKEILSHSRNLVNAIDVGNVDFDDTYKDIINAASVDVNRGPDNEIKKKYLKALQDITLGRVRVENEEFYLLPIGQSNSKLEFQLVAEGMRKIALLWQLIKNGTLEKGSILFWDEPEANINPSNITAIVDLLLDLQENGVQVFIATHDYFLAKYLDLRKKANTRITFHSLYKSSTTISRIEHECADEFTSLEQNMIIAEQFKIYQEELKKVLH